MKTFELDIQPRFCETDALGHVGNTVLPCWFEQGREPLFEIFIPGLKIADWNLIVKKIEVDFMAQLYLGHPVKVVTYLSKLGSSSFVVVQEAWQKGQLCARGEAVMIHFDYAQQKPQPIPEPIRQQLSELLHA